MRRRAQALWIRAQAPDMRGNPPPPGRRDPVAVAGWNYLAATGMPCWINSWRWRKKAKVEFKQINLTQDNAKLFVRALRGGLNNPRQLEPGSGSPCMALY
ncbi:MAG: hypothetical protein ACOYMG_14445 [Candidatus Methylumidiphilus sp.]